MSNRRDLPWNAVTRDLKSDRIQRDAVREEAGLGGMVTWRGESGRRYVVTAKPRDLAPVNAVVIAVARDGGVAKIVAVASFDAEANGFPLFRTIAHAAGAGELQMHSLADTAERRAAIVADLTSARVDAAAFARAPLATSGGFDRKAIMSAARDLVRARQAATGETWGACIGPALKAAWAVAKAVRAALQH